MWKHTEKRRLLALERRKARQQKGSGRFRQTCLAIGRLHQRAANRRRDFAHKTSTALAKNHGLVAVEALVVPNMTHSARGTIDAPGRNVPQKAGLNRAILNKGWGLVIEQLQYKCTCYGGMLVDVPARNTSLECAACGHISPDNRPLRAVFACVRCGHADHADTNAAVNVRERGIEKLAQTVGSRGSGVRLPRHWEPGVNHSWKPLHDDQPGWRQDMRTAIDPERHRQTSNPELDPQLDTLPQGAANRPQRSVQHVKDLQHVAAEEARTALVPNWVHFHG
jgi:transposase